MKNHIFLIIILILIAISGFGYMYLQNKHNKAISTLNSQLSGQRTTVSEATTRNDYLEYTNKQLTSDYNELVGDYNDLRNNVIEHFGSTSYQQRQTISCSSYTYGGSSWASTNLNCY